MYRWWYLNDLTWLSHVRSSVIVVTLRDMYIVRRHEDVKPLCLLSLCKAFLYSSWLEIMSASIRGLQTILLYCVIKLSTMLLLLNSTLRDVTNWALVVFYCMFIMLVLLCSRTIVHCWYVYTVCMYVFTCSSNNKTVRLNNGLDSTFVCDFHSMVQEGQTETQVIQCIQDHTIGCITSNEHSENYCLTSQRD